LRSLLLLKQTLRAMSPTAITNAATAATDSPAIWAGVILGRSSAVAGTAATEGEGVEVAEGVEEIESTMADAVGVT
jgi:hypothetical protein